MVEIVELDSVVQEINDLGGVLHCERIVHFSSAHDQILELSDESFGSSHILFWDSVFLQQIWQVVNELE